MIKYLRAQLERCLMDRAFRTLHDKIADQDKQIRNLLAAREKVAGHAKHQDAEVRYVIREKKESQGELDRQLGINRVLKTKRHIESQRNKALVEQLRMQIDEGLFLEICMQHNAQPDSKFIDEDFRI